MICRFCSKEMLYLHGHAACVANGCPMYGANQSECCDGETAAQYQTPASAAAAVPAAGHRGVSTTELRSLEDVKRLIGSTPPLPALLVEAERRLDDDPGHDLSHALRVGLWTVRLSGPSVPSRLAIAAALFHDLVNLPKDHPERANASVRSAAEARPILAQHGFAKTEVDEVCAAIVDHSFSRGAVPKSLLGRALQDADRLEALGVLGMFRTISTGSRLGARYFDAEDPWARGRPLNDKAFSVDHFFTKLMKLATTMCTERGRQEAERRTATMRLLLERLGEELASPLPRD